MKLNFGHFLVITFAVLGLLISSHITTLEKSQKNSRVIVGACRSILIDTIEAESGERGYLSTNNPKFLDDYNVSVKNEKESFKTLVLASPDSDLTKELTRLTSSEFNQLNLVIGLKKAGRTQEALDVVNENQGKYTDAMQFLVQQTRDKDKANIDAEEVEITLCMRRMKQGLFITLSCVLISYFMSIVAHFRRHRKIMLP